MIKKEIRYFFLRVLFLCFSGIYLAFSQVTTRDSLRAEVSTFFESDIGNEQTEKYVDLLNDLASEYRYLNNDSLGIVAKKALQKAEEINYKLGIAKATLRLADYYSDKGDNEGALTNYSKAKETSSTLKLPELEVDILISLSTHYNLNLNLENALKTLLQAIEMAKTNNLFEREAKLHHNLGYLYANYELYGEAHSEYLKAITLWDVLENRGFKAATLANIALNAVNKGDLDLAKVNAEKSIDILEQKKLPLWLARSYRAKSRCFLEKDSLVKSLFWLRKSDSLLSAFVNVRERLENDIIYSDLYLKAEKYNEAEEVTLRSLASSVQLNDSVKQVKAYLNLKTIEYHKGNLKTAFEYDKKGSRLKEKTDSSIKDQNILLLKAKMDFQQENEKIEQQKNIAKIEQEKYLQLSVSIFVIAVVIVLLILLSNRKVKELNKKLEAKTVILSENEAKLNQINNNQDKLFAIVGHDLRAPIISLKELLKFTLQNSSDEKVFAKFGSKLYKDLEHIQFTLENLLNWGKVQMKGASTEKNTIAVKEEVDDIIALFEQNLDDKKIQMTNEVPDKIEVFADLNQFRVIIRNLLNNAIKFTPQSGNIWVRAVQEDQKLKITIKDTGIGMSSHTLQKIMENTENYSTFGTAMEQGTGLGLQLCKEMLFKNNGSISVESKENEGSTFNVFLPINP